MSKNSKIIESLDPEKDHQQIVHLLIGYEFPWDFQRSLEIALLRTFTSPSISKLLNATGEFQRQGQKRYDDTGLLIAEFFMHGYESGRGQEAIKRMNELHGKYKIPNEDFLFVLSTFVLDPIDWIDQFGWRKLSHKEKQGLFLFWQNVGLKMGFREIPGSLQDLRTFAENYIKFKCVYDDANEILVSRVLEIIKNWLPKSFRWMVYPVINSLIDENMQRSFGFKKPNKLLRSILIILLKTRGFFVRFLPKPNKSNFFNEKKNRTYKSLNYDISDLGPKFD